MTKYLRGACLGVLMLVPLSGAAQVTNLMPADEAVFALEVNKPFFEGGDFGFVTSTVHGRLLVPIGDRVHLMGDLGLSIATFDEATGTTLSNVEVGLVFANQDDLPKGRLSVVLPTAQEWGDEGFASLTGFLVDPERVDRFIPDVMSVNGFLTPTRRTSQGLMGLEFGGSAIIPTDDGGDTEFFARYGAFITTETGNARLGAQLSGQAVVSESDLDFGERTIHQLTLLAGLVNGPDVFLRLPLDGDLNDAVNAVVGVRVTF